MATIHRNATLTPSKVDLLTPWVEQQRWYADKSRTPRLRDLGSYRFDDPAAEVGIEVLLLSDDAAVTPTVYQVPVTYRADPLELAEQALIGTMQHSELGTRYVYDACHDSVFVTELLRTIQTGAQQADLTTPAGDALPAKVTVSGSGRPGAHVSEVASCQVLSGEQSNTSVIIHLVDAPPVIVKIFRVLHDGHNPDVELQTALSAAGSEVVPHAIGSLSGSWSQPDGSAAHGDLAFAEEFLPGVLDAWRHASAAAEADQDYSAAARSLGAATAAMHATLAEAMGCTDPTPADVSHLIGQMRERLDRAVADEPALAELRDSYEAVLARAEVADWPALQRIHGDFHLGQVLQVPDRGWVMLDFEGEPLRPLAERSLPDSPVRDVAGMLRSFDYAAGSAEVRGSGSRREWSEACQRAFLEGYTAGSPVDRDVLTAYEIDKAIYEVSYEVRNRPAWKHIPLAAINRLLGSPQRLETAQPAPPVPEHEADALLAGLHRDPHSVLGGQKDAAGPYIRALRPLATTVQVALPGGERVPLQHEYEGIWSARVPGSEVPDYRIITTYGDGVEHVADDPYRFLPSLGEMDLFLIGQGRHEELWNALGARVHRYDGPLGEVTGTAFAVWAPNAKGVRVIGEFNGWNGTTHPMRLLGGSGVWELFVPDVGAGTRYKFQVLGADRVWREKTDPMARFTETSPKTAAIVTESHYEWGDADWLAERASTDPHTGPMSTYEVHLGSWREGQSYRDLAEHLVNYVKDLGFTHVEFMPVMEHPYPPSWGYHVTGYYAPNSRLGNPDDLRYLIDTLHQNGIGVILDWVPGHFATDEWALVRFDGTALYEHPDRRRGWHPEWGSYIFNFGRTEVRNFLVANASYWLEEFHADGLRVDGVASMLYLDYARSEGQWLPNRYGGRENLEAVELLQEANATAYRRSPGSVMIAEESTSWPGVTQPTDAGGLGFGLKWNMGWMHDTLDYFHEEPIHRQYHHNKITFGFVYAWSERFVLPISHDEVVHGKGSLMRKMPGDRWNQLANVRAFLGHQWSHPGKQLLFMGCEFAQEAEWADGRSLDWWLLRHPEHYGIHALVKDLNRIYTDTPALWSLDHQGDGFQWINGDDAGGNTFSYLRWGAGERGPDNVVAAILNASGTEHRDITVGLPFTGEWAEVLNTDAEAYGGAGRGNLGSVTAVPGEANGQPASARTTLPPLSMIWLIPVQE